MPTPEEEAAAAKAAEEKAAADKAKAEQEAADAAKAKADADKLGPGGEAALKAERKRAADAEKALKEAQAKLKEIEDASLSEAERLKKEAEDGKALAASAVTQLREAKLLTALIEAKVANPRAAARLVDGVEYADDHSPSNLDAVITAAKATYGDEMFRASKPAAPDINGGGGSDNNGNTPGLTADELAAAKASGMTPEEFKHYQDPHAGPYVPAKT